MSVLLYTQNNKQSEMRFRAAKSMHFMQKVFGLSMVFFVIVLYFIWLLTGNVLNSNFFSIRIQKNNAKYSNNKSYLSRRYESFN